MIKKRKMMKKLFLILLVVGMLQSCTKSTSPDKEISEFVKTNYSHDAEQLYLHDINTNTNQPNAETIDIDEDEINRILGLIDCVYKLEGEERDSVFDVHDIHTYYCYSTNTILLKVNTDDDAIKKLVNKEFATGDSQLDAMLTKYSIDSVELAYSYPSFPWLSVTSTNGRFNLRPTVEEFNSLENVIISEYNKLCAGDGNNITWMKDGNADILTFSIGWGDCPSGCINHRYWEFKIEDQKAEFVKAYN